MRQRTVGLYEADQPLGRRSDGGQCGTHVVGPVAFQILRQSGTERGNRRDGIHNLVSKHPDKTGPGFSLIVLHLPRDVIESNNLDILRMKSCGTSTYGKLNIAFFRSDRST